MKLSHFKLILFVFISQLAASGDPLVIKGHELWVAGTQVTSTNGKIENFKVSPSGRYAAVQKIIGQTVDPDDTLKPGKSLRWSPPFQFSL